MQGASNGGGADSNYHDFPEYPPVPIILIDESHLDKPCTDHWHKSMSVVYDGEDAKGNRSSKQLWRAVPPTILTLLSLILLIVGFCTMAWTYGRAASGSAFTPSTITATYSLGLTGRWTCVQPVGKCVFTRGNFETLRSDHCNAFADAVLRRGCVESVIAFWMYVMSFFVLFSGFILFVLMIFRGRGPLTHAGATLSLLQAAATLTVIGMYIHIRSMQLSTQPPGFNENFGPSFWCAVGSALLSTAAGILGLFYPCNWGSCHN